MLKHFCTKLLAKEKTGHPTHSMKVLHQNQEVLAKPKGSCLRSCTPYLSLIVVSSASSLESWSLLSSCPSPDVSLERRKSSL